jgi:cytochrome c553
LGVLSPKPTAQSLKLFLLCKQSHYANVRACGFCHLADGSGRPENAPVSAYHPAYFTQQMAAPKVRLQGGMHMAVPANDGGGIEPIHADEIVEVPEDNLRAEARDTRMGWIAYVPPGTLNRGKQVAAKYQCTLCHGTNLEGIGAVPPLAGRSPSYTMRQLFDMKHGTRRGTWSELMKPIVTRMTVQEMMAVSAFAASVQPPTGARPTTTSAAR